MRKNHPTQDAAMPIGRLGDRPASLREIRKWASRGSMGEVNDLCNFARKLLRDGGWPYLDKMYLYKDDGTYRVAKTLDFAERLSPGEKRKFMRLSRVIRSINRNADAEHYAARVIECGNTLHQLRERGDIDGCISAARNVQHFYWCLKAEISFRKPYERHHRQIRNLLEYGQRVSVKARTTKQHLQQAANTIWETKPHLTASAVAKAIVIKFSNPWMYCYSKSGRRKLGWNTIRRKIKKPVAADQH